MGSKISGKDLIKLGFPQNNTINIGLAQIQRYRKREKKESILLEIKEVFTTRIGAGFGDVQTQVCTYGRIIIYGN
ncbi:hypothetical protein [Sphingobacterium faecium]|uniref:hypothetical protein n=1 Tax=Sphingobacterium faecium TaxID=34087 RepID=UPI002468F05A|nr:hypothetical protein [Sphingobacterium faecium]MDH5826657.1 hypothetical protein [Sphingobacterium faecium]